MAEERDYVEREELHTVLREFKDDVRHDIKLYVGLGVAGGNAIAAILIAKLSPGTGSTVAAAARAILPL